MYINIAWGEFHQASHGSHGHDEIIPLSIRIYTTLFPGSSRQAQVDKLQKTLQNTTALAMQPTMSGISITYP